MKKPLAIVSLLLALLMLMSLCGCDKTAKTAKEKLESNNKEQTSSDIVGNWGNYGKVQLVFNEDGTGRFYSAECSSYEFNGKTLNIVTENGMNFTIDIRLFGEDLVIFDTSYTYKHYSAIANKFASGRWVCKGDDYEYSFEFFEDGTFIEDGKYTGTYAVDEEEMILIYDECEDYKKGDYCYCIINMEKDVLDVYYGLSFARYDASAVVSGGDAVSSADAA